MTRDLERDIRELEKRVRKLESIIDHEHAYSLTDNPHLEPQTIDCVCGETFTVNIDHGLVCPYCGAGSEERGETRA